MWETLRLIVLFLAVAVAPGLAFTMTRTRERGERRTSDAVLAAGTVVGLTTWVVVASLLVRLDLLRPGVVWGAAGVVAVTSAVAVRAHRRRRTARDLGRGVLSLRSLLPFLVCIAAAVPQLLVVARRPDSLVSPTAWYYWLTARSVAEAGGVPDTVREWGETLPAFTFHSGFSAATALLSVGSGDTGSLAAAQLVRVVTVLSLGLGVWFLARSLDASEVTATCAVVLSELVSIYAIKLSSLRPEALAYGFACTATALLVWGLRQRDRWLLAASAVGAVGVSQVHALSALLAVAMMAGAAGAHLLGLWGDAGARSRIVHVCGYVVVAGAAAAAAGLVLTGRVSEGASAAGLPDIGPDGDPTWAFAQLVAGGPPPAAPGMDAPSTGQLAEQSLTASFVSAPSWTFALVGVFCLLCLAVLAWRREVGRRTWAVIVFGVVSLTAMVLLAYLLSLLGDTYVPRRTGFSRLLQLWPLVPVVVAAALAGLVAARPWRQLVAAVLVVGTAVAVLVGWPAVLDLGKGQPSTAALDEVAGLPIDAGSTVLTNAYTQGFVTLNTPGEGLLDGHAPYLERNLLSRANGILESARGFFQGGSEFPYDEYGVDYVLVAKRPYVLGTSATWAVRRPDRLRRDPRLELVDDSEDLVLYRVVPAG